MKKKKKQEKKRIGEVDEMQVSIVVSWCKCKCK